jgi:kinesin family protein 2/24
VVWEPRTKVDLTKYTEKHEFAFDDVYPEEIDNDEIYNTTVHPLIGTIFNRCKVGRSKMTPGKGVNEKPYREK